jgi:hypothetical protein
MSFVFSFSHVMEKINSKNADDDLGSISIQGDKVSFICERMNERAKE